jgi:MerR family transcriptional regulator, light-induced transcriptional regulator
VSATPAYDRRRYLADRIRALAPKVAEEITGEFLERHPDWLERYGDLARVRGGEDARFHLDFLAGAVESGSPAAFADYGRWTAAMLASRDIAPHFLVENFEQLREALGARLDPEDHHWIGTLVQAGIEAARAVADASPAADGPDGPGAGDDLSLSRSLYLQAILQGDKRAAMTVVEEALRGHPVTAVYRRIVEEAQVEVGALWARNEISVAREHMATAVSQYVLGELYTRLPVPGEVVGRTVITGVEGERHQLGANMVADLLEAEGWSVRFLGTQMPHRDIVKAVEEHEADTVGISATMLFNLGSVANLIRDLRALEGRDLRIMLGGRAFQSSPEVWREMGADGVGRNLDEAVELFRRLAE